MSTLSELERTSGKISAEDIRAQLARILESASFKNSKRHPRFLHFIVEKTICGRTEDIKERSIGIEVFDRQPDYDLANDAIVRVAAGEVRKRLAQYYVEEAHAHELRIELPTGSYIPVFLAANHHQPSNETAHVEMLELPHSSTTVPSVTATVEHRSLQSRQIILGKRPAWRPVFWGVGAAIVICGAITLAYQERPGRALDQFWKPILAGDQSVVMCVGDLNWMMAPDDTNIVTEPLNQIMTRRNHVGPYDVGAVATIADFLGANGKHLSLSLGDNTDLSGLRAGPAIFVGAFDNPWTQRILAGFRFQFVRDTGANIANIQDSQNTRQLNWEVDFTKPLSAISRDHAIVARVSSALTGQTDLVIAGIGPYGTTAASEFVRNPKYFNQFASQAPAGWQNKNVEIVLSTDVVNGRSGPPNIVSFDVR